MGGHLSVRDVEAERGLAMTVDVDREDADRVAGAVRSAVEDRLRWSVRLVRPPVAVPVGYGPNAYLCALADRQPPPWDGVLVVRAYPLDVPLRRLALKREREWIGFAAAHGYPVPTPLAAWPDSVATTVLFSRGPDHSVAETMVEQPSAVPELLTRTGDLHAFLHDLPLDHTPRAPYVEPPTGFRRSPFEDLDRDLAAAGLLPRSQFRQARRWLAEHHDGTGRPVVCHGDFQPANIWFDPDDDDPERLVVANWTRLAVAEREYDVALTVLLLWSTPYLALGAIECAARKLERERMIEEYMAAYQRHVMLDPDRLRYWGVFHSCARLARVALAGQRSRDVWDPMAQVRHPMAHANDLARRLNDLVGGD